MRRVDRDAMRRSIAQARAESQPRREQIADKLKSEPWAEVGAFAAYGCQMRALRLRPWMWPPCWVDDDEIADALAIADDVHGRRAAALLLQRMLRSASAGSSRTRSPRSSAPKPKQRQRRRKEARMPPRPLALTDSQLDQVLRCATPLSPPLRRAFLEQLADALRDRTEIGDGELWRACHEVQRRLWNPPHLGSYGKYR